MLIVLLTALGIALLVTVVVGAAILLRAAYWGEQDVQARLREAATWRPPFADGEDLKGWAAQTTEQVVRRRLEAARTAETPADVMIELGEGAVHAMLPLASEAEWDRTVICPEGMPGAGGVTAVEILAIVADLRRNQSRPALRRIHDRALDNVRQLAAAPSTVAMSALPCALRGSDGLCCAYPARPLQCRPRHAREISRRSAGSSAALADGVGEPPSRGTYEQIVADGMEQGLAQAIRSVNLPATRYEFNAALARALELPDAAERWARGEDVFAPCPAVPATSQAAAAR